jgi:hypothetical protein
MTLRVGISNASSDLDLIGEAIERKKATEWWVPKDSQPGDTLVIYLEGSGFLAVGFIAKHPVPTGKTGVYGADIADLRWIDPPITKAKLTQVCPEWDWLRYSRSYVTPPDWVQSAISSLL